MDEDRERADRPRGAVAAGVEALRARDWYAAHEHFEDAWRDASGTRRRRLQGLVHLAVALEHLRRGNPRGCRSQWHKGRDKLAGAGERWEGIAIARWLAELDRLFAAIDLDARAAAGGDDAALGPLPVPAERWPVPPDALDPGAAS